MNTFYAIRDKKTERFLKYEWDSDYGFNNMVDVELPILISTPELAEQTLKVYDYNPPERLTWLRIKEPEIVIINYTIESYVKET